MIDKGRFEKILARYMDDFACRWNDDQEYYKWNAVQHFQKSWNIKADNFADMLASALSKAYNLLASYNNYPASTIIEFAKAAPEDVRSMFRSLYDESQDVCARISAFKNKSEELKKKYNPDAKQHYQHENAITTYLWLRFPEKYCIYKYEDIRNTASELKSDYLFKQGAYLENIRNYIKLSNEITKSLQKEDTCSQMIQSYLTNAGYDYPQPRTLTSDFIFYTSRFIVQEDAVEPESDDWWPSMGEYTPGFTKAKWLELLNNPKIIGPIWGGTLASFYVAGGEATCTQIAEETNDSPYSISGRCTNLAKRIHKETKCKLLEQDGKKRYWPILFQGKSAGTDIPGSFIWKLRPELYEALTDFDIMGKFGMKTVDPPMVNPDELQSKAEFKRWFRPLLDALIELGGSAPRLKIHEKIISMCGITAEELSKKSSVQINLTGHEII